MKVGTRGSILALRQTELVKESLAALTSPVVLETEVIKTTGDMRQGTPLAATLDKKAWIRELESAIVSEQVDFAIHSGKDVPFDIEDGTMLLPVLPRANPADCFVGRLRSDGTRKRFSEVEEGGKVGTSSLRRRASLLRLRPDLEVVEHRGNVQTRIRKLDESADLEGIVLACAGIDRLDEVSVVYDAFDTRSYVPALAQGSLIAQFKASRNDIFEVLQKISSPVTQAIYNAERGCAEALRVSCHSVLGVYGELVGNQVELHARVLSADGATCLEARGSMELGGKLQALGVEVANELLERGAESLLRPA